MNIAIAQLNYHIGNFEQNAQNIIAHIRKAQSEGADIVVFSELSVCGYPPLDLLEQRDFVEACLQTVQTIALECIEIAAVVGCPTLNEGEKGKRLFNSALFLYNGSMYAQFNKTLLPTYDIFDEYRYFEPNTDFSVIEFKGKKIAITICEDLWDKQVVETAFAKDKIYKTSPLEILSTYSPDFVINIAASPFSYNQDYLRSKVLQDNASLYKLPIIYVNQVGANTEIIFDGCSKIVNSQGKIVYELAEFQEDFYMFDVENISQMLVVQEEPYNKIKKIHDALILGIRDYFRKNNFTSAVLGLSGGIDSAVVLALVVEAIGAEYVRVLLMPSEFSSFHSVDDAVALARTLQVQYDIIPIHSMYNATIQSLSTVFANKPFNVAEENIQARLRGVLLMGISNKFGAILLNTSNKSEAAVGYSTMYGDMNGSLSILGDVYKTDVYKLAEYINKETEIIPHNTIIKPPSAELRPNQKDSDSLPDYDTLDAILFEYIEKKLSTHEIIEQGFAPETVLKTVRLVNANEYKRFQFPPILRVSSKAFGFGRRIPLVAKYEFDTI